MSSNEINGSVGILFQNRIYWNEVVMIASVKLRSDGCSGVTQLYQEPCLAHDIHYRTHKDIYGNPITKSQADKQFRKDMQVRSKLGYFSPLPWLRFWGLTVFFRKESKRAWKG